MSKKQTRFQLFFTKDMQNAALTVSRVCDAIQNDVSKFMAFRHMKPENAGYEAEAKRWANRNPIVDFHTQALKQARQILGKHYDHTRDSKEGEKWYSELLAKLGLYEHGMCVLVPGYTSV